MGSTKDTNRRWTDFLWERLHAARGPSSPAVVNAGIAGNMVLHELVGASALDRLDRDVLGQPGVGYVIVLEGTNDVGIDAPELVASAEEIIAGHRKIIDRVHGRGLRVYGGTLPPLEGMTSPLQYSAEVEAKRAAVNEWIRTGGAYDAILDFDRALRDPGHTKRLRPEFDSGDHGHPNDAGYEAMADAIDLKLFADAPR